MPIAYDAGSALGVTPGTTWTLSHTCASGAFLVVGITSITTGSTCSGVTYNGVAMTQVVDYTPVRQGKKMYIYVLANPASGANNIVASFNQSTNGRMYGNSFTGCTSASAADATGNNSEADSTLAVSVTTVADNCWLVGHSKDDAGGATAGTNTTARACVSTGEGDRSWSTSAAQTPAGSKSMAASAGGASGWDWVAISIAPAPSTLIKTINGLARASCKTINGLAIASIKTLNGLT